MITIGVFILIATIKQMFLERLEDASSEILALLCTPLTKF